MKLRGKFPRYALSVIALFHGVVFLFIADLSFGIDKAFHSQWILTNFLQNMTFLLVAIFFLWIAYLLFRIRQWARVFAALAFSGTLIWLLYDFLSSEPSEWKSLLWLIPSVVGLVFLLAPSSESSTQPTEKLA